MAKLLYVTCDLNPVENSHSLIVGSEFLNEYINCNPEDEVYMLDLYRDHIQRSDDDVLRGLDKIRIGHHFAALTEDEQRKVGRIWKLIEQFNAMDKYVFVTPMLQMEFPEIFKLYIDTVSVVNRTNLYTPLVLGENSKTLNRKCLLIHSIDSLDSKNERINCMSYFEFALQLIGIKDLELFAVRVTDRINKNIRGCLGAEIEKALKTAVIF